MSYSFNVRAANKAEAKAAISSRFDEVVTQQPVHAADKDQAQAAAHAFVDLLPEVTDGREICVSVGGYLSGIWEGSDIKELSTASFSVTASWVTPTPVA